MSWACRPSWTTTPTWARWAKAVSARGAATRRCFYMTLSTGIGGGICYDGENLRGADCWAGEIGHLSDPAGRSRVPVRLRAAASSACAAASWLERDYGKQRQGAAARPGFRRALRGGSRAGSEGVYHDVEPGADRDRRRYQQGRRARSSVRCARNWAARSPTGRARAWTWFRPRWVTIACSTARSRWPEH